MKASPVTQLLTYLAEPDRASYAVLDQALIALLRGFARPSRTEQGVRLTLRGEIHIDIAPAGATMLPRRLWVDAKTPGSITEENWRDFLRFANIIWLANNAVAVEVGEREVVEKHEAPSAVEAAVSALWREAIEEFEDEPEVAAALRTLAEAGAAETEEIGEELRGLPTALTWVEHHVALMLDEEGTDAGAEAKLREDGWTLLYPGSLDTETIPAALLGKE